MSTLVQPAIRYGYAPLMLLGINGIGIALAASGANKLWLIALLVVLTPLTVAVNSRRR